jgi:two-component system KDP operon response regulator KdpE
MVKVLFIDDDPLAHETLAKILPDPYTPISAYTARQDIEATTREVPDVVLLDIGLPDMDGIDALKQITPHHRPS